MKKQNLLILFLGVVFLGFTVMSCGKSDGPGQEDDDQDDDDLVETLSPYLEGSGYHLIALDEVSATNIASKIVKDYRVDDVNSHLFIWHGYEAGISNGPNAFGEVEEWMSLSVTGPDWSGGGFNYDIIREEGQTDQTHPAPFKVDLRGVSDDYVLHFAIKSRRNDIHQIIVPGRNGTEVLLAIGSGPFGDSGVAPYANFPRDGEWHHIEVPVSYLKDQGLDLSAPFNGNTFAFLSGPTVGSTLEIDGIFYYKPK